MVSRRALAILRSLLVAASLTVFAAGPVSAKHEPARFGLTPVGRDATFFELTMRPGDNKHLRVEAANFGHEEADARTYAADVYSIVNGGFGADLFGELPAGPTLWVTYPTQELTLGPDDAVLIDFEVSVPDSTRPGEYITALVIENSEPVVGSGGIAFDQVNRSAIAIAITVPGRARPALEIGQLRHEEVGGISVITFEVGNTGNVHLQPTGEFVLRGHGDTEIAAAPVTMDSVYAGMSTLLEAPVGQLLPPGAYCAELQLSDHSTGASAATDCLAFEVAAPVDEGGQDGGPLPEITTPAVGAFRDWPVMIVPGLLLAAAGAVLLLIWRRRRSAARVVPATVGRIPATDQPSPVRETPADTVGRVMGMLRKALRAEPRVHRAWIIERKAGFVLAIETQPGLAPEEVARVAHELQNFTDQALDQAMPLQVEYVSTDRPGGSTTGDAVPFYVNAGDSDVVN